MAGYIGSRAVLVSNGAERKKTYAITSTTTNLTGLNYTVNQVHVYHNGVRLVDGTDFTATDGNSITLTTAAENGDEVVVISYAGYQVSDTVSASLGGTFSSDIAIDGDLTVDTDTLCVDSANNRVGVGTTSPSEALEVATAVNGTPTRIELSANDTGGTTRTGSVFFDADTNTVGFRNGGSNVVHADSSGNLLVGRTAAWDFNSANTEGVGIAPTHVFASRNSGASGYFKRATSNGTVVEFYRGTSGVGNISVTTSATAYNTSSDYRLKENVEPLTGAADRVLALKPSRFNFISEPDKVVDGFIAHEAQEVVPEAVTGEKDAVDADGNPEYQGIDQSKLVPLLTAALQEALTEIDNLKERVTALEGN